MKRFLKLTMAITSFLVIMGLAVTAGASSAFFDTSAATAGTYVANDIISNQYFGGYDVSGATVYGWANNTLKIMNKNNGAVISDLGTPDNYTGYNSFVRLDPTGTSSWVGFTVEGNVDDRIYQVDHATGTWTQMATMAGNFDMDFSNGNAYVSGLNSTDWSDPTSIWRLDTSGADNHDKIVEMSGNSAGLAFDAAGNAYYASYDGGGLYRWAAADIAGAAGAGNLNYTDGTKLTDLELGAYDVDVDDAGNVIFNGNGGYSFTAVWNGTEGDGTNYDYIGIGPGSHWFSFIDSEGDVTKDGSLYQADFYNNGIAEAKPVPVPAAVWLLGTGLAALAGIRRKAVRF
ncbi:MAG: VPLPA-CTERM sorting domain-containing protein [Desulfobacter sp.]|nr:MAG: VPLPA-CTERM sorting domain-containing protein [Desulfobacter sp.]